MGNSKSVLRIRRSGNLHELLILYLFTITFIYKFIIVSLRNKYNKIFQQSSHNKITGSFYTETKTTIYIL